MASILKKRAAEQSQSRFAGMKKSRKRLGIILTIFSLIFMISMMRGITEKFVPGWAFYIWQ